MDLQRDLRPLLQALADAEDALRPEMAAELPPDLQSKYDVFRHDVHHMVQRAQALGAEGARARSQG